MALSKAGKCWKMLRQTARTDGEEYEPLPAEVRFISIEERAGVQ